MGICLTICRASNVGVGSVRPRRGCEFLVHLNRAGADESPYVAMLRAFQRRGMCCYGADLLFLGQASARSLAL